MNYCLQVFCLNLFFLEITQSLKWIIKEWLKVSGKRNVTDALVFQWQMLGLLSPLWRPTSFLAGSDRAFVPGSTSTPRTFASCSWRGWSETKLKTRNDWKVTYFLLLQSQSPVSHNSSPQSPPNDNSMFLSNSKFLSFCHGHFNLIVIHILPNSKVILYLCKDQHNNTDPARLICPELISFTSCPRERTERYFYVNTIV